MLEIVSGQYAVGHGGLHRTDIYEHSIGKVLSYVFDCGGKPSLMPSAIERSRGQAGFVTAESRWLMFPRCKCHDCAELVDHYWRIWSIERSNHGGAPDIRPERALDLVVISHLDADHVNGIDHLHKRSSIGRLLLPYIDSEAVVAAAITGDDALTDANLSALTRLAEIARSGVDVVEVVPSTGDDTPPLESENPRATDDEERGTSRIYWHGQQTIGSGSPVAAVGWGRKTHWELVPIVPVRVAGTWSRFLVELAKIDLGVHDALVRADRTGKSAAERITAIIETLASASARKGIRLATQRTLDGDSEKTAVPRLNPTSIVLYSGPAPDSFSSNAEDSIAWLHTGDLPLSDQQLYRDLVTQMGKQRCKAVGFFSLAHHGARDGSNQSLNTDFPNVFTALACRCSQYNHPRDQDSKAYSTIGWADRRVFTDHDFTRYDTF